MSLLTIGTMAFDNVETPFGKAERIVGGACTYISYSASYFTDEINLSAVIGGDFPQEELDSLTARGVNLEGLEIKKDEKSFFWAGKYHMNMNSRDTLVTELNVLADFNPVLPASYKSSEFVMLGNLTPAIQLNVLDQLDGNQHLIAMDTMNFWMDIAMDDLLKVIKKVDLLIINDEEARQLSGQHSIVKAAEVIKSMGCKYLIIKKGEHGALLFYDNHIFFAPAIPLAEVFDPTGAGDTFAGGVMGYLAKTKDLSYANFKRSIIYGSAMASFCVEKFGVERLKELNEELIYNRVKEFSELVRFEI